MLLLGIDLGSSSVKASVIDGVSAKVLSSAIHPPSGFSTYSPGPGLAEQNPDEWWESVTMAVRGALTPLGSQRNDIGAIGISYQMHGLVIADSGHKVIRRAIVSPDKRATELGDKAFERIGKDFCLHHLLNSPGSFTASMLGWVRENEPELFSRTDKVMLPGDYLAMRMTGEIATTAAGLSEGIFWDYIRDSVSDELLSYYQIPHDMLPSLVPPFGRQGTLTAAAATGMGLTQGIPVTYRAGSQSNIALSLNVMRPGRVALTAGMSGTIYGVTDRLQYDPLQRVNTFMHTSHTERLSRLGVLLGINGAGSLNAWLYNNTGQGVSYSKMNTMAAGVEPGSDGLVMLPFGNGAERMIRNNRPGASLYGLNFNNHRQEHLYRGALEAIAYSFRFGMEILKEMGINPVRIHAATSDMFQSTLFSEILTSLTSTPLILYDSDGAVGAAIGAGLGVNFYKSAEEVFDTIKPAGTTEPDAALSRIYDVRYMEWLDLLHQQTENL